MEKTSSDKKKYDSKQYYNKFKETHKEKLNEKIICELCGGKYSYFNKSHHNKSKKHYIALIQKKLNDLESNSYHFSDMKE